MMLLSDASMLLGPDGIYVSTAAPDVIGEQPGADRPAVMDVEQ